MEAIILAGGLGTRLRSAVPDLPKCMAPVNGKPFLYYVVSYLQQQGVTRFILSLGYMHEHITNYCAAQFPSLDIDYSIEAEPLGTGGAIQLACAKANSNHVIATNGDTLFMADLKALQQFHLASYATCTLALKPMQDFDRYGVVELDASGAICSFKEKQYYKSGLINGGLYFLDKSALLQTNLPQKFSFEKDYLEQHFNNKMFGLAQDNYFIDIGIPEDFERAQTEFQQLTF